MNSALTLFGLRDAVPQASCKTTAIYTICGIELPGDIDLSADGPPGSGKTRRVALLSHRASIDDQTFVNLMGALIVAYQPSLTKEDRIKLAEELVAGFRSDQRKGSAEIDGSYFSLTRPHPGGAHFHIIRD